MQKSLVFTIAVGSHRKLFKSCVQSQKVYADKHTHDFFVVDKTPRQLLPAEASWLKIGMIKAALLHGYEWVAFIDADCDVRPHSPCFVEQFEKYGDEKCLYLAPGISGRLNAGVIFARNAPAAIDFFDIVERNADMKVSAEDRTLFENGHVIHFSRGNPAVQVLEHLLWNNNSKMDPESYIQHYSGGPLRLWYMDNRAPWITARKVAERARRAIRKAGRLFGRRIESNPLPSRDYRDNPDVIMSKRLRELQSFYSAEYSAFQNASAQRVEA